MELALRNLFFTILQPGVVAGLIPYLILESYNQLRFELTTLYHYVGVLIFCTGLFIMFKCIFHFARIGKGTLSPVDPTQNLVVKGLYTFSRNPMYIGVLLILLGETIYMKSIYLLGYTLLVFIGFHFFIKYIEEPRLRKDFGEDYDNYTKQVRRWL